ncbi:hypothetical protein, partial [Cecembia lonarensis]|uniref:hypothetical protein n=1 Tax=Cecembia lonarensis TaxID=645110 RepID=UPI00058ACC5E
LKGFIKNNIVVGLSWLSWFRHGQVSRALKKLSSFASVKDFSLSFPCPSGQAGNVERNLKDAALGFFTPRFTEGPSVKK